MDLIPSDTLRHTILKIACSSEVITRIYLYHREHDVLNFVSRLTYPGYHKLKINGDKIKVKADNYNAGNSSRCCPWKYEIGEFKIKKSGISYLGHTFEDIPDE